mmetsp:Transcript_12030/g.33854  ORF Transcript_12030/g.33854 Transcript_12030/m.33854 type:complete len:208 (-) Transcript_12030:798-1421(-)
MQLLPPMPNPPRRRSAKPRLSAGTVVSSSAPDAAFAMASIACTRPAPAPLLMAIIAAQIAALASCRRCWGRRRRVRRATVRRDAPVRDVGRVLVALLGAAAALVSVKPIHVRGVPVAGHERHALLQRSSLHMALSCAFGPMLFASEWPSWDMVVVTIRSPFTTLNSWENVNILLPSMVWPGPTLNSCSVDLTSGSPHLWHCQSGWPS